MYTKEKVFDLKDATKWLMISCPGAAIAVTIRFDLVDELEEKKSFLIIMRS